jgi:hypothetical protein
MHATTEQLLSLRDGLPVDAAVAAHAARCEDCRRRQRGLEQVRDGLRALPELAPPAGLWSAVAAGTQRPRRLLRNAATGRWSSARPRGSCWGWP